MVPLTFILYFCMMCINYNWWWEGQSCHIGWCGKNLWELLNLREVKTFKPAIDPLCRGSMNQPQPPQKTLSSTDKCLFSFGLDPFGHFPSKTGSMTIKQFPCSHLFFFFLPLLELAPVPCDREGALGVREADPRARQREVTFSCYFRGWKSALNRSYLLTFSCYFRGW